jgi:hypothetical protein
VRLSPKIASLYAVKRRTALLPLVLVAWLASACSGASGDKPSALPTITSVPATATPAPVPPQATAATPQALDAFVRFYFDQLNVAFSTSDASIIRRLSDPVCQTCAKYSTSLDQSPRQVIDGVSFAVSDVAAPPVNAGGTLVEVYGTVPARRLVDRDGKLVRQLPASGTFHLELNVVRGPSGWLVRGIRPGRQG